VWSRCAQSGRFMASGGLIRIVALASFSNPVTCDRSHVHNISRIIICYTSYYFRRLHTLLLRWRARAFFWTGRRMPSVDVRQSVFLLRPHVQNRTRAAPPENTQLSALPKNRTRSAERVIFYSDGGNPPILFRISKRRLICDLLKALMSCK
jgi:hypothetical protein